MSESIWKLYERQIEIKETMQSISINIILESEYQENSKLDNLEDLWKEFAMNHVKIQHEHSLRKDDVISYNYYDSLWIKVVQVSETFNRMRYSDAKGCHKLAEAIKKVGQEVVKRDLEEMRTTVAAENTDKQQQTQPSKKAKALLLEFERCIQRLKQQFEEIDQIADKFMLEEAREAWQKQHDKISDIYMKLCADHLVNDEKIIKCKEEIENQHRLAKRKLLQKLNALNEVETTTKAAENTDKQTQIQPSMKAKALLFEFDRCIRSLKQQFKEIDEIDDKFMLEEAKETWQQQHDNISDIYMKLCVDHLVSDEKIIECKEEIENQHRLAKRKLLQKLNKLTELKKALRLNEIKIPSFNGNIEEWLSFHNMFKEFVHESKTLSDVEKMYQLKSLLRNEALNMIKHLAVSESNYAAAWKLLNQRFDNRRMLFQSLIDRIIQQPNVNSNNSAMMKSLHDVTNECMQGLIAMKCNIEGADAVIARIVIQKLDNEGLISYEQHTKKSKEIQVLSDVLEFLEEQYQSLELAKSRKSYNFSNNSSNEKQRQQTKALPVSLENEHCLYCEKGGHTTEFCRKFLKLEVEDRLEWSKITKTCVQCLNHKFTYNCLSKSTCITCGMAHHNILHIPSVSTSLLRTNNDDLLPTAQVRMVTEKGDSIALRVSIDPESKKIFIDEE